MKRILLALILVFCQYAVAHAALVYSSCTDITGTGTKFNFTVSGISSYAILTSDSQVVKEIPIVSAEIISIGYWGDGLPKFSSTVRTLTKSGPERGYTLITLNDLVGKVISIQSVSLKLSYSDNSGGPLFVFWPIILLPSPCPIYIKDLLGTSITPKGITIGLTGSVVGQPEFNQVHLDFSLPR